MTARQIADTLQENQISISAVYRNLAAYLGEKEAEQLIHSTLETTGFQIDTSETVLYGVCADCRK